MQTLGLLQQCPLPDPTAFRSTSKPQGYTTSPTCQGRLQLGQRSQAAIPGHWHPHEHSPCPSCWAAGWCQAWKLPWKLRAARLAPHPCPAERHYCSLPTSIITPLACLAMPFHDSQASWPSLMLEPLAACMTAHLNTSTTKALSEAQRCGLVLLAAGCSDNDWSHLCVCTSVCLGCLAGPPPCRQPWQLLLPGLLALLPPWEEQPRGSRAGAAA